MTTAPIFSIVRIDFFERRVELRLPFRFGAATLETATQVFVRACIRLPNGRESWGATAELMVPKWFDKNPRLSAEDNVVQLRCALSSAREAYTADSSPRTAFGHFAAHYSECLVAGQRRGLPALAAQFGPAEIDRALLDALCRALETSFAKALRANLIGFDASVVAPDLAGFGGSALLARLAPRETIALRHTVGLLDAIGGQSAQVADGLPESLEEVIASYRPSWFKIKLSGDARADVARLIDIARVLDGLRHYRVTLDGNEQFADARHVADLMARVAAEQRLKRLAGAIAFIEQPIARERALEEDVWALGTTIPFVIDESDASLDAFVRARDHGYRGVSNKGCKGLYKSLANLARCAHWNEAAGTARYFLTAEDLTTQPGLALQQDLALAALLGIEHAERNGHHYVNGFAGALESEQTEFLAAHPDLYERSHGQVRVAIRDGEIGLSSLWGQGFASAAMPDWSSLTPQPAAASALDPSDRKTAAAVNLE